MTAPVQYAGGVPGLVAGVFQINVQIPPGVQAGNAVPLTLQIGNGSTQTGVTLAVQPATTTPTGALSVSVDASAELVASGTSLGYNLSVGNVGTTAARNVVVSNVLPAGFNPQPHPL